MKTMPPPGHQTHLPAARTALRQRLRAQRRALSTAEQRAAATALNRLFGHSALFHRSRHIAFYLSNDGELDTAPLMQRAWAMGKVCYLPVITPGRRLWFAPYAAGDDLITNRYGIPEPATADLVGARQLDLILAPLVAFDDGGHRLGMGGGFYDRTLSFLRHRRVWRKPRLIGIAHQLQRVERLAAAPWDVPLDGVATDQRLYLFYNSMSRGGGPI
jgi:5-formyltetrahydrofolate cyclo-ligase